jgi:pantoate--beta-alanine ligase
MIIFRKAADLKNYLGNVRNKKRKIGFVPTMGALHQGHISLVEACKKENDVSVCSIFVNERQFNNRVDFEKYPASVESDIYQLEKAGCGILFLPTETEVYPPSLADKHFDLGYVETVLEGTYRPGHFQGVCQVVEKLLDIVRPDMLYLGQKDYQQCIIIKKLVSLMGKSDVISIRIHPTMREPDGLAMSSRNIRLSKEDRKRAPHIYKALINLRTNLQEGNLQSLINEVKEKLKIHDFKIDYLEVADAETLELVNQLKGNQKLVALVAVSLSDVRLIDNILLN